MLLIDTETAMPPDWKPAYRGQATDPLHARIWQIALLDLDTGTGQTWLVNPGFSLPAENRELSNVDDDLHARVMAASSIAQVLPEVFDALAPDGVVVAYNAGYDRRVMLEETRRHAIRLPRPQVPIVWGDYLVRARCRFPAERSLKLSSLARLCNVQQEGAHTALADLRTLAACMESEDRRLWSEWWHIEQHRAWVAGDLPADEMQATDSLIYGGTLGAIGQDGLARIGRSAGRVPDNWTFRTALHNGREWSTNVGHPWLERAWIDWLNSATPNE